MNPDWRDFHPKPIDIDDPIRQGLSSLLCLSNLAYHLLVRCLLPDESFFCQVVALTGTTSSSSEFDTAPIYAPLRFGRLEFADGNRSWLRQ